VLAVALALAVGGLTRLLLLIKSGGDVTWDSSLLGAFAWGSLFDLGAALWWSIGIVIGLAFVPAGFFQGRLGRALAYTALFTLGFGLGFGALAEWLFWDEFGVRFNFIAVDYLVYTTEVIGNIRESYPLPALFGALGLLALTGTWVLRRTGWMEAWLNHAQPTPRRRWSFALTWTAGVVVFGSVLRQDQLPEFANAFNGELAKSGLWSLVAAFRGNQLDYEAFYPTLPAEKAFARIHHTLERSQAAPTILHHDMAPSVAPDLLRQIVNSGPEQRLNVIQITVESLSAEFLARYGNKANLTPNLDQLIPNALVFDQFYATGTRTDRGMEALTLSVPPTPGRSLVKRPDNDGLFTLGSVFRSKGYATTFVYGGYGYFDNMNTFFGGNGYKVLDRSMVQRSDVTFANAWGACDEDLFRWTLREADQEFAAQRPFFHFVMTTSNHRPFTYPDGKIDLPSKSSGRDGGVKYTDHAIAEFLREASTRPWFKNTIFVIVADHCASSAGKTELPIQNYHIPLIIYTPGGQVKPGAISTLSSQIDYAPTLLGLMGWSYPSRFYGWDIRSLPENASGRALVGTYQKLGLYRDGQLTVLQPIRRSTTYRYDTQTHGLIPQTRDLGSTDDAIAYYQTASWLFKHRAQRELLHDPLAD